MSIQLWGDIQAQIASNVVAERRIRELVERYGLEGLDVAYETALSYSRRRFLTALEYWPTARPRRATSSRTTVEATGRSRSVSASRSRRDGVVVDFTGTDPQVLAPVNSRSPARRRR